ncbi:HigA family addiction module antitoxin [Roseovarius sp. SK2]|jgi:addiction module HigA family antidote|uniref:HigA family addiction module antitoxin n=1 Tax=Roseovarius TaxID=74030 RepID=UPI00237B2C19|nr:MULTISPECIES: HigA family addiction module antitoxin [unclassified Roseovarius]MDD9726521.1 HigA family addiction module antitoxin [Roseovarius sp. SK2]
MTMLQVPVHPGDVLNELYLEPLNMSAPALAKKLGVPRTRIERVCKGEVALSVDTAFRLAKFFGTTPEYWVNMQKNYELIRARSEIDVSNIQPLEAA